MIAPTSTRVENCTDPVVKENIRDQMQVRIARYEDATHHELTYRLAELDQEWDIERVLEFNFSGVVLGGIALGTISSRKWYLLPAVAACFMVQHVIEGWCPPLVVLRRLGFRTAGEINHERTVLKILRGDFAHLDLPGSQLGSSSSLLHAVEE